MEPTPSCPPSHVYAIYWGSVPSSPSPMQWTLLFFSGYGGSSYANILTPTFSDIGPVPAGPVVSGAGLFVAADPVMGCSSASNFFLSDIGFDCSSFVNKGGVAACVAAQSNVSVSASTDGGATFAAPNVAIAKNYPDHTLDKDWMVVDSASTAKFIVTWHRHRPSSGNVCAARRVPLRSANSDRVGKFKRRRIPWWRHRLRSPTYALICSSTPTLR